MCHRSDFFSTTTSVRAAKWPGLEFNATLMSLLVDIRHHKYGGWQLRRRDDQDLDPRITRLQTFHLQSGLGHIWFLCFWNETTVPEVQPCGSCWDQTQTPPDYNLTTINISPFAACEFSPPKGAHMLQYNALVKSFLSHVLHVSIHPAHWSIKSLFHWSIIARTTPRLPLRVCSTMNRTETGSYKAPEVTKDESW